LLQVGDTADCIVVEDLTDFKTLETYINGELVYDNGESKIKHVNFENLNNFNTSKKVVEDFRVEANKESSGDVTLSVGAERSRSAVEVSEPSNSQKIRVIECLDGELVTNQIIEDATIKDGNLVSNTENDILKMTVVNRYQNDKPAMAFIKNFGLKEGAIASSVGHDSHNIIAVGVSDEAICKAVNLLIENEGGICTVSNTEQNVVALPVAGIMSDKDAETIGKQYSELDKMAKQLGSKLHAPYMSLSFMALLVIPSLKLSDKGLFDGGKFEFTDLSVN